MADMSLGVSKWACMWWTPTSGTFQATARPLAKVNPTESADVMPGPLVTDTKSGRRRGRLPSSLLLLLLAQDNEELPGGASCGSASTADLTILASVRPCDWTVGSGLMPPYSVLSAVARWWKSSLAAPPGPRSFSSSATHVSSHDVSMASIPEPTSPLPSRDSLTPWNASPKAESSISILRSNSDVPGRSPRLLKSPGVRGLLGVGAAGTGAGAGAVVAAGCWAPAAGVPIAEVPPGAPPGAGTGVPAPPLGDGPIAPEPLAASDAFLGTTTQSPLPVPWSGAVGGVGSLLAGVSVLPMSTSCDVLGAAWGCGGGG
ncbi:hypothetical protein PspLS_04170 [Pyricularia sp. CBS 133598]|nr:hypothetical protein PspLS_04170 [Pyricularia sp. CBS 133598]